MKATRVWLAMATLGALGVVALPSSAATGNVAECTVYMTGKVEPGLNDLVVPQSGGTFHLAGPVTCTGQALGRDLPKYPGTMTVTGQIAKGPLGPVYGDSCMLGSDAAHTEIVWSTPRRGGRAGSTELRMSGDRSIVYAGFDEVTYGELSGEEMIGHFGIGADPDGHYAVCTKEDSFTDVAVSGRFVLLDARSGAGVAHQHVVAGFQYLPSGSVNANPTDTTAPFLVDYPTVQGDSITFTNADTHPHTVTACLAPCTALHPERSAAFDGDIPQLGDQFTIDTSRLPAGKYHYFCEMHPWMRGSFSVSPRA